DYEGGEGCSEAMRALASRPFCSCDSRRAGPVVFIRSVQVHGLAEFEREILRERVKAGIVQARQRGTRHGRPPTVARWGDEVRHLYVIGQSKAAIARRLGISRTSVRRFLG